MPRYCQSLSIKICLLILLLEIVPSIYCQGQNNAPLDISPKLQQFLTDHPAASKALFSALSEAFGRRTVRIYYFYSSDESAAKADHLYPDKNTVWIRIRENQLPGDECICLIFEMLNSEGEQHFIELNEKAKTKQISRNDFATDMMQQEFVAVKKTRDLIKSFDLNQKEKEESYYYNRLVQAPDDFNEFLIYIAKVSPKRAQFADYEKYYDSLGGKPEAGKP